MVMRDIKKRAIICSSICGIVLALLMYTLRLTVISGPSMEPTLSPGNVAVIGRTITNPEPGDIVLIDKEGRLIIKRVVAIEGQEVSLPDDPVYTGPYWGSNTIPEGYIFLAGDNAENSKDSRYTDFGLVAIEDVWGKVLFSF